MLEITILKVEHGAASNIAAKTEAMKLIPYIDTADVFCPEQAYLSLRKAKSYELYWRDYFLMLSRKKFEQESVRRGDNSYVANYWLACFLRQKPIYFLERFSEEEVKEFSVLYAAQDSLEFDSVSALKSFDVDKFYELQELQIATMYKFLDRRDSKIADTLQICEDEIRQTYPNSKFKKCIKLVTFVGALHRPEFYYTGNSTIVDLTNIATSARALYVEKIRARAPFDEIKPILLDYAKEKGFIKG